MIELSGQEVLEHLQPALTTTDIGVSKMADHKIYGNNGAGNVDLIRRIDAMQACQVGPSDEWAKATKDGYNQAATDCAMAILRIAPISSTAPAVLPLLPDMVDAATAAGVVVWWDNEAQEIKMAVTVREAARVLLGVFEDPYANAPHGFDWQSMYDEMTADHKESLDICGTHDWPSTLIVALRAIAGCEA